MALESSLVQQAKGSFLLCDAAFPEQAVHISVEITRIDSYSAGYFVALFVSCYGLRADQLFESLQAGPRDFAEEEFAEPFWLTFKDKGSGP
jgi:hypothetical protein